MISALLSIVLKFYILTGILQQGFYENKFLIKYLFKKSFLFFPSFLFILYYFLEYKFLLSIAFLIILIGFIIILIKQKIKLKITRRVIRLFLCYLILILILSIFIPVILIEVFVPIILFISMCINKPIENMIGKYYIKKAQIKLSFSDSVKIAITGSYGKTSVKNYLAQTLQKDYLVHFTPKSYNTPLGIAKFVNETNLFMSDFFIYEFGARRVNDIKELQSIYKYDIAIVTGINEMHIDTFKTQENIIHEKMRLTEKINDDGFVILNYECPYIRNYVVNQKKFTYGFNYGEYQAKNILIKTDGVEFDVYCDGAFLRHFSLNLLGRQAILNVMPTIIISILYKVDLGYIEEIVGVDNRLTKRQFADYIILDDAYNSNMLGVEYALEVLKEYDGKRFILTPGLVEMDIKMDSLASRYAKLIDESCDFCILIENTFTKCMVKYINKCKVFLVKTFSLGFSLFMRIKDKNSALLIENDLPDAY